MISSNPSGRSQSFFDETMKLVSYCPLCENRYNFLEARILEESGSGSLMYIRCQHCSSAILAVLVHSHGGVSSIGVVTDLQPEEVLKFEGNDDLSDDDILASYQYLQKIDTMLELLGSR